MALVLGTNCGFVTVAPSGDPDGGGSHPNDTRAAASKFVSPAANNKIISIGWYTDRDTDAVNSQVGIYSHDSGNNRPDALLATSGDVTKGTGIGWKTATIDYELEASTIYWLAVQLDDSTPNTYIDNGPIASSSLQLKLNQTELPTPWGTTDSAFDTWAYAIYALYEEIPETNVTVEPSAETLTLTQQTPKVVIPITIEPSAQTLTLTSPAPTLSIEPVVSPSALSLALSIPVPTEAFDYNFDVAAQSLSLTQQSPNLNYDYVLTPARQALTLSQQTPSVNYDYALTTPTQTLSLTQKSPTPSIGNPYIKVQRKQVTFASGSEEQDVSLDNEVVTANSFIIVKANSNAGDISGVEVTAEFKDTSTITLKRGSSTLDATINVEVVEADDEALTPAFSVTHDEVSIASGDLSATETVSLSDYTNSMVLVNSRTTGTLANNAQRTKTRGKLNSNTELKLTRQGTGIEIVVRYQVVEWSSAVSVETGTTTMTASSGETATISAVVLAQTALFITSSSDTDGLAQTSPRGYFNSTTQLGFTRKTTLGNSTIEWAVLEFPASVTVASDQVSIGTTNPEVNETISAVILANSFLAFSNDCTGTGTAYPRSYVTGRLETTTNIEFIETYQGQTKLVEYFVVDTSGWTFEDTTIFYPETFELNLRLLPSVGGETGGYQPLHTHWGFQDFRASAKPPGISLFWKGRIVDEDHYEMNFPSKDQKADSSYLKEIPERVTRTRGQTGEDVNVPMVPLMPSVKRRKDNQLAMFLEGETLHNKTIFTRDGVKGAKYGEGVESDVGLLSKWKETNKTKN